MAQPVYDEKIISQFMAVSTPNVSDALDRLGIAGAPQGILPLFPSQKVDSPFTRRGLPSSRSAGGAVGTVTWAEDPETEASQVWEQELDAHGAWDRVAARSRRDEPMNSPEKMRGLFSVAGLESVRVWLDRFEYHWDLDGLSAMHSTFGRSNRKLESLDTPTRAAFLGRVRDRLLRVPSEAFVYRAAVVCGLACRPS